MDVRLEEPHTALRGRWRVDPSAAVVTFSGRAWRLAPAFGARFDRVDGTVDVDDGPDGCCVDVHVDLASMTTGNRAYDDLLAVLDPFELAAHPFASYRSRRVRLAGPRAVVDGELWLRGTPVPVRLSGQAGLVGAARARLRAAGQVDRRCFPLRVDLPGSGVVVPNTMRVEVDVEVERTG